MGFGDSLTIFLTTIVLLMQQLQLCPFSVHRGMDIGVQSDGRIGVTKKLTERFYIHSRFNAPGCKGMAQPVVIYRADIRLL